MNYEDNKKLDKSLDKQFKNATDWHHDVYESVVTERNRYFMLLIIALVTISVLAIAIANGVFRSKTEYVLALVDTNLGSVTGPITIEEFQNNYGDLLSRVEISFLTKYVIKRASFNHKDKHENRQFISDHSSPGETAKYEELVTGEKSPLLSMAESDRIDVKILNMHRIDNQTMLVRFSTTRTGKNIYNNNAAVWSAKVSYRIFDVDENDPRRFDNILGFQVIDYHQRQETLTK